MISKEQYETMKRWINQYENEQKDLRAPNLFDLVKIGNCVFVLDKTSERPDKYLPYLRKSMKLEPGEIIILDLSICNDGELGDEMYYVNFDKSYTVKHIKVTDKNHEKLKNKIIDLRLKL